jgi:Undecaprenyl-phosphate glucose phosphotransferase
MWRLKPKIFAADGPARETPNGRASTDNSDPSSPAEDADHPSGDGFDSSLLPSYRHAGRMFVLILGILSCSIDTGAIIGTGLAGIEIGPAIGLPMTLSPSVVVTFGVGYLVMAWLLRLYPRRRAALGGGELGPIVRLLGGLSVGALAFRLGEDGLSLTEFVPWVGWLAAAVIIIKGGQIVLTGLVRSFAASQFQRPAVVVGNNEAARQLVRGLGSDAATPYRLVGFFDDAQDRTGPLDGVVPYLGTLDAVARYSENCDELDVFLVVPWTDGPRILKVMEQLRFLPVTIRLILDLSAYAGLSANDAAVAAKMLPVLQTPPLPPYQRAMKAAIDLGLGSILLILLLPVLLGIAIAIKLNSPGPVIFTQPRRGQYGRLFSIYKFRSLYVANADTNADNVVSKGDLRVTRVGRFIRKYSLDELPQIINVLKGDMSLVGPRPHAINTKADGKLFADVVPNYSLRYRVKPGLTGWAQVNGWRGETDTQDKLRRRVEYDFHYISHWSLRLDLTILLRTVPAMLFPSAGSY